MAVAAQSATTAAPAQAAPSGLTDRAKAIDEDIRLRQVAPFQSYGLPAKTPLAGAGCVTPSRST